MKRRVSCRAFCAALIVAFVLGSVDAPARRGPAHAKARVICDHGASSGSAPRALRFGSVAEAEAAVDRILKVAGLTRNFVIKPSYDVGNAESGVDGNNRRYIYYNPAFMDRIKSKARTDYAALAIMAHEVGHHLLGHRIEDEGRSPWEEQEIRHRQELEADKYSGFILRYLGASVGEAQSAVESYQDESGSPTHPGMKARLDAIRAGWEEADRLIKELAAAEGARAPRPRPRPAPARAGSEVPRFSAHNTSARLPGGRWAWVVFIEAPPEVLEQVSCVVYRLHPTFRPSAIRVCERGKDGAFALKAQGWGSFKIQIHVEMKDRRQYELSHELRL